MAQKNMKFCAKNMEYSAERKKMLQKNMKYCAEKKYTYGPKNLKYCAKTILNTVQKK